jgi:hypothetical protein
VAVEIAYGECIQTQVVVDDLEVDITVIVPGIVAILNMPTMGRIRDAPYTLLDAAMSSSSIQ